MIKARFKASDLKRVKTALSRVESEMQRQARRLPYYCALGYTQGVVDAIVTKKYSFQPYTPGYEDWKRKTVGHLDFWLLHGDMLKSLTVFKYSLEGKNGWFGGILPGALNRESKLIKMYAGRNEQIRPLFERSRTDYVATQLPLEAAMSLNEIRKKWA